MSKFSAQSVAITLSSQKKGFNGDNFNVNGRVVTAQNADAPKGYKMAGESVSPFRCAVASSNKRAFAAGALNALNEYQDSIDGQRFTSENGVISYFNDMKTVLEKTGIKDAELSISLLSAFETSVVVARMGACHILRYTDGDMFEVALPKQNEDFGFSYIENLHDGDIFVCLGEHTSSNLDYEAMLKILSSNVSLKVMLKQIFEMTLRDEDSTILLTKFTLDDEENNEKPVSAAVPVIPTEKKSESGVKLNFVNETKDEDSVTPEQIDESQSQETQSQVIVETETGDETASTDDEKVDEKVRPVTTKRRILNAIPIAILIILLAVAGALYCASHTKLDNKAPSKKVQEQSTVAESPDLQNIVDVSERAMVTAPTQAARENVDVYYVPEQNNEPEYNEETPNEETPNEETPNEETPNEEAPVDE